VYKRQPEALLRRHDGLEMEGIPSKKSPYVLFLPVEPTAATTLDGLVAPAGEVSNRPFVEDYLPQLMQEALAGKLQLYSSEPYHRLLSDPLQDFVDREDEGDEFDDDWEDVDWNDVLTEKERRDKLEQIDFGLFANGVRVVARLEKQGNEIVLVPEWLEVSVLFASHDSPQFFAAIKVEEVAQPFSGSSLKDFLRSEACWMYPLRIAGQDFDSLAEGHWMGWCLEHDWERIPDAGKLKEMRRNQSFRAALENVSR